MSKFEVGDRVAVYMNGQRLVGVIRPNPKNNSPETLWVRFPESAPGKNDWREHIAHPRQCRRLKPKRERREIWIRCAGMGMSTLSCRLQNDAVILNLGSSGPAGYVLFREVCPKRGVK
jgi:hypothetical protein